MQNNIRAVLFDLDGTLLDTAPDLIAAIDRTLLEHGREPLDEKKFRRYISGGSKSMLCYGFGISDSDPEYNGILQQFLQHYQEHIAEKTKFFPGMEKLIEYIEKTGMLWGVVTNKPTWLTTPLFSSLGLDKRAACIVCGDTLPQSKPDPEPLLYACTLLGVSPNNCIYIGDTEVDILAARAAHIYSIAVTYGYHAENSLPEDWHADLIVESPHEIALWLSYK